jgi:hypothetical protein
VSPSSPEPYSRLAELLEAAVAQLHQGHGDTAAELQSAAGELMADLGSPPAGATGALERAVRANLRLRSELLIRRATLVRASAALSRARRAAAGYEPPVPAAVGLSASA